MPFDNTLHPRASTNGRFVADTHSIPEITIMAEQVTCTECGLQRVRGAAHRCPAPGLLKLSDATKKVLAACRAAGGRPHIVGGSVRDALISRQTATAPKDIDIEVYDVAAYETLQRQLEKIGRVDLAGASFGILIALVDGEDFDVSLPRTDSKAGDGHRGFVTTPDATLDEVTAAGRRDFTINAMSWDPNTEELIDPWGGTADLAAGVLRHTTDAFSEDPLRVLRGVAFSARFGFAMAPETAELAASIADEFEHLPSSRVWGVWRSIATRGIHISKALETLEQTGWLRHFPALADTRGTEQDAIWHPEGDVFTHLGLTGDIAAANAIRDGLSAADREIAVLGAILHDVGKPTTTVRTVNADGTERITSQGHAEAGAPIARNFLAAIGAPGDIADKVAPLVDEHMCHTSTDGRPSATAVRRMIRRLSAGPNAPTIYDWARVVDADSAGRGAGAKESPASLWLSVADEVGPEPKKGYLNGRHLIAAGWTPSPAFRAVLDASIAAQDAGLIDSDAGARAWFAEHGEQIRSSMPDSALGWP